MLTVDHYEIIRRKVRDGMTQRDVAKALGHSRNTVAKALNYPIIPCDLCGSQDGLQRQQVKQILDGWERNSPGRRQVMFRALMNARPSHLLDSGLFDFAGLMRNSEQFETSSGNVPDLR